MYFAVRVDAELLSPTQTLNNAVRIGSVFEISRAELSRNECRTGSKGVDRA